MENETYGQPDMSGDLGDFFGGATTPPESGPAAVHSAHTKEYADFSVPTAPAAARRPSTVPWTAMAVVAVVLLVTGFVGYRLLLGS